jgi:outer membrane biosynthesis protein TonB
MEQIRRVVMSRMGAFSACYETALSKDPDLKGGVTMSFSISPGGSVAAASVSTSSLANPRVEGCMLRTFNRLKFPVADKPTNSVFPFVFKGKR